MAIEKWELMQIARVFSRTLAHGMMGTARLKYEIRQKETGEERNESGKKHSGHERSPIGTIVQIYFNSSVTQGRGQTAVSQKPLQTAVCKLFT